MRSYLAARHNNREGREGRGKGDRDGGGGWGEQEGGDGKGDEEDEGWGEGEEEGGEAEGGFDEATFHDWYILLPHLESDRISWSITIFSWFLELDFLGCFTIDDIWKNRIALWKSQKEFFMLVAYLQAHRQAREHVRHYFGKTGVASKLGEYSYGINISLMVL